MSEGKASHILPKSDRRACLSSAGSKVPTPVPDPDTLVDCDCNILLPLELTGERIGTLEVGGQSVVKSLDDDCRDLDRSRKGR